MERAVPKLESQGQGVTCGPLRCLSFTTPELREGLTDCSSPKEWRREAPQRRAVPGFPPPPFFGFVISALLGRTLARNLVSVHRIPLFLPESLSFTSLETNPRGPACERFPDSLGSQEKPQRTLLIIKGRSWEF